jgi:hypothetical protein
VTVPADPDPGSAPGEQAGERETVVTTTVETADISMPLQPSPEQVLDAAARLIAVGELFSERLRTAIDAANKRDNRRRTQIYLIGTGLLADILLTFVVFGIVQSNHVTANRLAHALAAQQQQSAVVSQVHADQLKACAARNAKDAQLSGTLNQFITTFGTTAFGPRGDSYIAQLQGRVTTALRPVNCAALYALPSPSPSPSPAHPTGLPPHALPAL